MCVCCVFSHVWLFETPWTVALQAPFPWNFSGKNTGVDSHFLLQGILLSQGSNPHLLYLQHWQVDSLPLCHVRRAFGNDRYHWCAHSFVNLMDKKLEWISSIIYLPFLFLFFLWCIIWSCPLFFFMILKNLFIFNWRIIALKCWLGFCLTSSWISHRYTYVPSLLNLPPPTPSHPFRLSLNTNLSFLCHIANSHWLFVLHMVRYVFQCCSLNSSYPLLLPLCPQVCSLCLCLFCCPLNSFILLTELRTILSAVVVWKINWLSFIIYDASILPLSSILLLTLFM